MQLETEQHVLRVQRLICECRARPHYTRHGGKPPHASVWCGRCTYMNWFHYATIQHGWQRSSEWGAFLQIRRCMAAMACRPVICGMP